MAALNVLGERLKRRYEILDELSDDGLMRIYDALDVRLEQRVWVHQLFPRELSVRFLSKVASMRELPGHIAGTYAEPMCTFLRRARGLSAVRGIESPYLPYDSFVAHDTGFAVTRRTCGPSLEQVLSAHESRPDATALLESLEPVVSDVAKLHAQGLTHGNISPQSIVAEKDHVTLAIPRLAPSMGGRHEALLRGCDSPYVAPEQPGSTEQCPTADVFALCSVIYRCVTGTVPPRPTDRLAKERLRTPEELGARMAHEQEKAIMRGMSLRPNLRPRGAKELYEALYSCGSPDSGYSALTTSSKRSLIDSSSCSAATE